MKQRIFLLLLLISSKAVPVFAQNFHSIGNFSKWVPKIKFNHSGKLLAACNMAGGSQVGYLELYDVEKEKIVASIPCDPTFAVFSADDSILITKIDDKTVGGFNISNLAEPKKIFEYPVTTAWCGDISADGSMYAFGSDDGQAFVIDAKTNRLITSSRPFPTNIMFTCCYNSCNFCPVWGIKMIGKYNYLVAGAGMNGRIAIMDFQQKAVFTTPYKGEMQGWSADKTGNHFLLNCIADNPIYTIPGGVRQTDKIGPAVKTLLYTASGNYIIAIANDKITLYDGSGKKLGKITDKKYLNNIQIADVSEDEKHIAFVYNEALIIGDLQAIINAVK